MKKFLFLAITVFLFSCGGNDASKDAQAVCDCFTKANGMAADAPDRAAEQDKCLKMQTENWDKYKDNAEDSKKFNDAMSECSKKMIENSLKEVAE